MHLLPTNDQKSQFCHSILTVWIARQSTSWNYLKSTWITWRPSILNFRCRNSLSIWLWCSGNAQTNCMRVKPSRDTAQPIKSGKHCDSTECRQMREFAASNTWKDDRKKKKDSDTCRKQKERYKRLRRRKMRNRRVRRRKGDKNKEQMRSPKVEEWDIRAVETGDILKLFSC